MMEGARAFLDPWNAISRLVGGKHDPIAEGRRRASLARRSYDAQRWRAAIRHYRKAVKQLPRQASWRFQLANALYKVGDRAEAIEQCRRAIELKKDQAAWWARLAAWLAEENDFLQAVEAYERALDIGPAMPAWAANLAEIRELSRKGGMLHLEKDSAWYDAFYLSSAIYAAHYRETPYYPVWERICQIIVQRAITSVLDIGCGSGQLAIAIKDADPDVVVHGIDFSNEAIAIAKQACPSANFAVGDARDRRCYQSIEYEAVVCTEVLEHIVDDYTVLSNVRRGSFFIGTVPNFDAPGHVRYFKDKSDVMARYASLFEGFRVDSIALTAQGTLHLFTGRRTAQ